MLLSKGEEACNARLNRGEIYHSPIPTSSRRAQCRVTLLPYQVEYYIPLPYRVESLNSSPKRTGKREGILSESL